MSPRKRVEHFGRNRDGVVHDSERRPEYTPPRDGPLLSSPDDASHVVEPYRRWKVGEAVNYNGSRGVVEYVGQGLMLDVRMLPGGELIRHISACLLDRT